jgi:hypothetical protein
MKLAIMQPYFAPYIGYFQLMKSVDNFVIYDNIQYTKKGWINRNRFLQNGTDELFAIPISKDSDFLDIRDRRLSSNFLEANKKTLRKFESSYRKAPYYNETLNELTKCFLYDKESNLFEYILNSLNVIKEYLKIDTRLIISSTIDDRNYCLKSKDRVLHICNSLGAEYYINPIGGVHLYDKKDFINNGVILNFIQPRKIEYKQFNNEFVPWLSIIDVLMFNSPDEVNRMLDQYELI